MLARAPSPLPLGAVAAMARTLLAGQNVVYGGDPLRDLTLAAFLEKFVQKKAKVGGRGSGTEHQSRHAPSSRSTCRSTRGREQRRGCGVVSCGRLVPGITHWAARRAGSPHSPHHIAINRPARLSAAGGRQGRLGDAAAGGGRAARWGAHLGSAGGGAVRGHINARRCFFAVFSFCLLAPGFCLAVACK
jgi:hypothetical protein